MKRSKLFVIAALFLLSPFMTWAETGLQQGSSVVEAVGYSTKSPGKSISDIHRDALADALKNAVIQAHTEIDIEACTENMQLEKQTVLTRSRGYVKSSQTVEAGFLSDDPSIYRIRRKALILPRLSSDKKSPQL